MLTGGMRHRRSVWLLQMIRGPLEGGWGDWSAGGRIRSDGLYGWRGRWGRGHGRGLRSGPGCVGGGVGKVGGRLGVCWVERRDGQREEGRMGGRRAELDDDLCMWEREGVRTRSDETRVRGRLKVSEAIGEYVWMDGGWTGLICTYVCRYVHMYVCAQVCI